MNGIRESTDTEQSRRKAAIERLLVQLLDMVESEGWYGEFGVTFTAQNGRIGHYEEMSKKTFK